VTIPFNLLQHPDAEVTRDYLCQFAGRSKTTAYRPERIDPLWLKPVVRDRHVFYQTGVCKRYLESPHLRTDSASPKTKPESF
jgi:hypothetical protein